MVIVEGVIPVNLRMSELICFPETIIFIYVEGLAVSAMGGRGLAWNDVGLQKIC